MTTDGRRPGPAKILARTLYGDHEPASDCLTVRPPLALDGNERAVSRVKAGEDALLCFQRRNEMLGYGLVGTIVVVVLSGLARPRVLNDCGLRRRRITLHRSGLSDWGGFAFHAAF